MASSLRASSSICGTLSRTAPTPRYVCRSCRKSLLRPHGQQMREASTLLSSSPKVRPIQQSTENPAPPRAFYASKSPMDYIRPRKEQPVEDYLGDEEDEGLYRLQPYEEATTWVGLESIGQESRFEEPSQPEDPFQPFVTLVAEEGINREYFLSHLYDAIVDVLVFKTLGKNMADLYTEGRHPGGRDVAASLGLAVSKSGAITGLQADASTLQAALGDETSTTSITARETEELLSNLKLNFSDPITFEILKYFSVISGRRVPDPVLSNVWNNSKTLTEFVDLLTRHYVQTKPKTIISTLKTRQEKALLMAAESGDVSTNVNGGETGAKPRRKLQPLGPNVMVLPRRETPVDKEKEIGRWKVIEQELIERGLPVLGKYPKQPLH